MGANRAYKNSVFSLLFSEPEALRELYGALEGVTLPPDTPVTINGSEVINMLFNEFDLEAELAAEREAGWEKGREERDLALAKNALAEGLPLDMVGKITGLDLETLTQLSSPPVASIFRPNTVNRNT
jgi:hypothetical protein